MRVEVRPASLFDIPTLRRLQREGISLDPKGTLTQAESPLRAVLRAPLTLRPSAFTYLAWTDDSPAALTGFVQARPRQAGQADAEITYISPALTDDAALAQLWARLLEVICWEMADAGIQRVFASLPADSGESIPFLNAGFVIFAREELLRCGALPASREPASVTLRPQTVADTWALQRLYAALVPLGVKQAEGLFGVGGVSGDAPMLASRVNAEAYVWESGGEMIGHVEVTRGKVGDWLHLTLHPDCRQQAEALLGAGLALLTPRGDAPVYTHVRSYESILTAALVERGFQVLGRRDLTVRQTLARVKEPAFAGVRALETQSGIPATPTVARIGHGSETYELAERMPCRRLAAR